MDNERQQLQQARDLILQKRFDDARALLRPIAHNPTARQWLDKLDSMAPPAAPPPTGAASGPIPRPTPAYPAAETTTLNVTYDPALVRLITASLVGVMAVLMIVGFFAFAWLDMTEMEIFGMRISDFAGEMDIDEGPLKITAMELWMGRNNDENFTLNVESPNGGFADVRFLDRLLILIPIGALMLLWLAWMYGSGTLPPVMGAGSMLVLAALLLAAPFMWEDLSNRELENSFQDSLRSGNTEFDMSDDPFGFGAMMGGSMLTGMMEGMYSTGEQALLGGVAVLVSLVALGLEFAGQPSRTPRRV